MLSDSLYLTIYFKVNASSESLPVMVFIYGGAFIGGYDEEINYGPHHFMDENVIMVAFNYRLGPFGKYL